LNTDTVITVLGQVSSRQSVTYTWPSTCINDLDSKIAIGLHTCYGASYKLLSMLLLLLLLLLLAKIFNCIQAF